MLKYILIMLALLGSAATAQSLVATRTIRSHAIITPDDVTLKDVVIPGSLTSLEDAVGLEARVVLYAGRPIRPGQVGPAAIIERNQIVMLVYARGGLRIMADARSLGRAGVGDFVRVMNLTSRTTVTGIVGTDGTVTVGH